MTKKLSTPFAINSTLRNDVPVNATNDQANKGIVGYNNGWTSINKLPLENGGQPPYMEDMNGLFFDITGNIVDINKGLPQYYDDAYATLIGGYPVGARLVLDDNSTTVISTISNNQNNPNTNMTGWVTFANLEARFIVDSIADLANISAKDGKLVYVKSYYSGANKGGGKRIYVSSRANENDGFLCINGWVLVLDNSIVNSYQAGAYGDGTTDDRPYIEKFIVISCANKLKMQILQDANHLLNSFGDKSISYASMYSAGVLPVYSGMDLQLDGKLILGPSFDNKDYMLFTDLNAPVNSPYIDVTGITIHGKGTIDLSKAGTRNVGSTYKLRIPIYWTHSKSVDISGITIRDGDTPNAMVFGGQGDDIKVHQCKFINLMSERTISDNDDHSTIYDDATNCRVFDNYFQMDTMNGHLNACPMEIHNSGSTFTNNTIIGYRNSGIVAATVNSFSVFNMSDNTAKVYRHAYTLDPQKDYYIRDGRVCDNVIELLAFPTEQELKDANLVKDGVPYSYLYGESYALIVLTNDGHDGFEGDTTEISGVDVTGNTMSNANASSTNTDISQRATILHINKAVSAGLNISNNNIECNRGVTMTPGFTSSSTAIGNYNINGLKINGNTLRGINRQDLNFINITCNTMLNCDLSFNVGLGASYANGFAYIHAVDYQNSGLCNFSLNTDVADTNIAITDTSNFLVYGKKVTYRYKSILSAYVALYDISITASSATRAFIINKSNLPSGVYISNCLTFDGSNSRLSAMCNNTTSTFNSYNVTAIIISD